MILHAIQKKRKRGGGTPINVPGSARNKASGDQDREKGKVVWGGARL